LLQPHILLARIKITDLISLIPNKSLVEKENLQSVAKDGFLPGRVHQETFVRDYQPKVITVGIGGNDVGFADKLRACLGPDTCSWAGTIEGREKTAVEMKGLFNKLVTTYQNLQNDSPNSKIYAIVYPRFIEPSGECSALRELLLDSVERRFIDEGVIYLNQIIKAAAKKVGIKYISFEDSYGNHRMCGSSPEEAANFIKAGDDIGLPGDWLSWVKLVGQDSFHPNALGHQLAAGQYWPLLTVISKPMIIAMDKFRARKMFQRQSLHLIGYRALIIIIPNRNWLILLAMLLG